MYWILAAIFLLIALLVPRLRLLGIVGCIIMGVMLGWGMVERLRGTDPAQVETPEQQRGRPSSPAVKLRAVPLTLVDAEDLRLTGSGAPFELRGRIENRATDVALRSVTIRVERRDCYEGALDPSGCVTLWADDRWIAVSVPPQSGRNFLDSIWMRGAAPRPRGTVRDEFRIVAAAGEIDAASPELK